MESARIVAGVARVVRDVGLAEDLAHDALIAAMDQWPRDALTLRLFGGLTTDEVARALLVESPTVGQRISRAKKKLAAEGPAALEVPVGDELTPRLGSVLEVVYLVFNEGYAASSGDHWT